MSSFTRFSAHLDLRYHSERVWEVLTPFSYDVAHLGSGITCSVPAGFITDGGSVPQSVWGIISPWEENCGQAFVVHDFLCIHKYLEFHQDSGKVDKVGITRKRADEILKESLQVLDTSPWKVAAIMVAVDGYRQLNRL